MSFQEEVKRFGGGGGRKMKLKSVFLIKITESKMRSFLRKMRSSRESKRKRQRERVGVGVGEESEYPA